MALLTGLIGLLAVLVFALLFHHLSRRHFPDNPAWVPALFTLTFALGGPLLFLVANSASPHHQSIALSVLTQGLIFLATVRLAESGQRRWALALGLSLALAISVRPTVLTLLPGLALAAVLLSPQPRWRSSLRRCCIPALCAGLAVAGLMAYNAARFGDPFETGMRTATGLAQQRDLLYDEGALISPRWIPLALWSYFLRLPTFDGLVPNVTGLGIYPVPPSLIDLFPPGHALAIDTHSVLFMTPALALVALLALHLSGGTASAREPRHLALGFSLAALGPILLLLCYWTVARRYVADFMPAGLLAAFLAVQLHLRAHPRHAPAMAILLGAATLWSAALHWQLAAIGARKVLSLMMIADAGRLSDFDQMPLLAALMAVAVVLELAGLRALGHARLDSTDTACPTPLTSPTT
jgi:hypothetical protein